MSVSPAVSVAELDDEGWGLLETAVNHLEQSWRKTPPADLAEFLPPVAVPLQRRLLLELVKVDQEKRWQNGERETIESYLRKFKQLGQDDATLVELVEAECLTRAAFDDLPTADELRRRFPAIHDRIDLDSIIQKAAQEQRTSDAPRSALPNHGGDTTNLRNDQTDWSIETTPRFSKGTRFGRYEIRDVIGRGGMATVYRAYDDRLQREVALKIPHGALLADPQAVERFIRESRSAAAIRHSNVCPTHDAGQIDGTPYISMALIEGRPLADLVQHDRLTPEEAADITRKLADALHHAHESGLVHRDVKPSNVMIDRQGEPLLMDFGLARQRHADENLTNSGSILGTPAYMSPEQVRGEPSAIDARTDVYGLGVLLYQLLTGRAPFENSLPQLLVDIENATPPSPRSQEPNIDPRLESICLKAMAKRRPDRYQTAQALSVDIQAYLQQPQAAGESRPGRVKTAIRIGLAAAAAAVLAFVIYLATDNGQLVVQSEVDDLAITITQNDEPVDSFTVSTAGKTIRLRSGRYEISFDRDPGDEIDIDKGQITVTRGRQVVVKIQRRAAPTAVVTELAETIDEPNVPRTPFDGFRREDIDPYELAMAGSGDPAQAPPQLVAILGDSRLQHWNGIHFASFSADGKMLITADTHSSVVFWDAATGKQIRSLVIDDLQGVVISEDRKTLATGHVGGSTDFWDVASGKHLKTLPSVGLDFHSHSVWSPDGKLFATPSPIDVNIRDAVTGDKLHSLNGHTLEITSLAFSPDSKLIASASRDGTARVWNSVTGEAIHVFEDFNGWVDSVAFTPDGKQLLTGSHGEPLRYWDVETGDIVRSLDVGTVMHIDFSPDHIKVALGVHSHASTVIDAESGDVLFSVDGRYNVAFSPDGQKLAVTTQSRRGIRIFDANTGDLLVGKGPHGCGHTCMAMSPDEHTLAAGCRDGTIRMWDLITGAAVRILEGLSKKEQDLAFSPDGTTLAGVGGAGMVRLWDVGTGDVIADCNLGTMIHSVAFHPEPAEFHATAEALPASLSRRTHPVAIVAAGDHVGTVTLGRVVRGEDVVTGVPTATIEPLRTFKGPDSAVTNVTFSPDGRLLASSEHSPDGKVLLRDVHTGELLHTFEAPHAGVGLAFSPNGRLLTSRFSPGVHGLRIWDVETGHVIQTGRGHSDMIQDIAFSPDGRFVASAAYDGTVRIARTDPQGNESVLYQRLVLGPAGGCIAGATFDRSGRHLITLNGNGTIYVLRLNQDGQ